MNAIQIRNRIDFYNNVSQSARFYNYEYDNAMNDAIRLFIDKTMGDISGRMPENFQWTQQVRDNLYTLIKTATPTITAGTAITNRYYTSLPSTIPFPTDYYDFVLLMCLIDGYTTYARPTIFNEIGPLLENSFMHPSNDKPYYNDSTAGLTIWRSNSGTFTTATLTYIKTPAVFTIGLESQYIIPGVNVLVNGSSYIAIEQSVQVGATVLPIGTQFTAVGTALISGQVILASLTLTSDLPPKVHEILAKKASEIMLGAVSSFDNSAFSEKQADENQ